MLFASSRPAWLRMQSKHFTLRLRSTGFADARARWMFRDAPMVGYAATVLGREVRRSYEDVALRQTVLVGRLLAGKRQGRLVTVQQ
jgi:hypothetical protein